MFIHWRHAAAISFFLVCLATPARADVVSDWYERAAAAGYRAGVTTPVNTRTIAIVALAMFDAANAIEPRYTPYRAQPAAKPGASTDAAIAAAAHYVLRRAYPDQAGDLDAAYHESLATLPHGSDTYNFWRPVTAIRNGDLDASDATERDPAWEPFISTPLHPEYPCAQCVTQASVATVLQAAFGDDIPEVTLTSSTAPGVIRRFTRLSTYVDEVVNARIYDGVHYRTSGEVGAAMGRQIGAYVVANWLKPTRQ